jgi:hypothetical protein
MSDDVEEADVAAGVAQGARDGSRLRRRAVRQWSDVNYRNGSHGYLFGSSPDPAGNIRARCFEIAARKIAARRKSMFRLIMTDRSVIIDR